MDGTETTQYDTAQYVTESHAVPQPDSNAITFQAAFPTSRDCLKSRANEAIKASLDVYPNPGESKSVLLAKLDALLDQETSFIVSITPDE